MTFIFHFIYGMNPFHWLSYFSKPPTTYQLNWWCKHEKHGGFPTHLLISPRKTDRIFQKGRFPEGRAGADPGKGQGGIVHGGAIGKSWRFPMGKPWKIMGNPGKMEVWMGKSLGNAGKILWSLIEVTELNGDEGFSSHGADYRKISENILSTWILWGIWFGWCSQEIHDFGGIDI